ncbi:membrane protein insertion efficiency factor YidD [Paenibacillus sp. PCH8]|nr:membrane protein insertion efficiency factor YidD [Paenibacillus sp. PCH8]
MVLIRVRAILIWNIQMYQRLAPKEVRNKCRFEPSCSVYMIQAIEKYGAIKGLSLGIQRLRKCNINGGGFDYP